jgi:L-lactate dehydrogenase complex protein LldE
VTRAAIFPTCVVDTVAPEVGIAAVRVLRRAGVEVSLAEGSTCCGQPAWNSGHADDAAKVAATTLAAFERALVDHDVVVVPAGSCATMATVFWPELFHVVGDEDRRRRAEAVAARVVELSSFLASDAVGEVTGPYPHKVAYHRSCHLLRELGVDEEPKALLGALDGCEAPPWDGDDRCCGFGGTFAVQQPELSTAMADDKLAKVAAMGAEVLVGCDQSCLIPLEGRLRKLGSDLPVRHIAEVLEEATR